jgi:DNA invertase Pin-like site-specific DNA recombinase
LDRQAVKAENGRKNVKAAIYVRVSTDKQTYEQQIEPCVNMCKIKGWDFDLFKEVESAGKDRPIWTHLMRETSAGKFNAIVVHRLDRAWRSSRQFIMDFDTLTSRNVFLISVMEGFDATTPVGKAMVTIFVALAELEKANISQATKDRLAALKNLGKTLGRPKGSKDSIQRKKTGYFLRAAKQRGDLKFVEKYNDLQASK